MKADFTTGPAQVEIVRDMPGAFRLIRDVAFWSAVHGREFRVPAGYVTDFASIPQFLKDRIDVNGLHREAAIVHDYGCTNGRDWQVSQSQVDGLLDEAMISLKVGTVTRKLMVWAVRGFQRFDCWRHDWGYHEVMK